MTDSFGIPQLIDYLTHMGLRTANVDQEQEIIELAFHGDNGQWRLIVNIQQSEEIRKLMFIVPHIGTITTKKRLQCLEALLAVNYRIAMGKFGIDLEDGEVRLEEAVPLANAGITEEQFQLVFSAMMQTAAMYHSLIPRIIYGNLTTQQALEACEEDFFQEIEDMQEITGITGEIKVTQALTETDSPPELDVHDVLAEVRRLLDEPKE
ncbi:MAG TPA: YbjN domain-containing protein [Ktedonobacteraceae bacterium]|jgi:hypothetical protein